MSDLISEVCEILSDLYPMDGEKVISIKELDKAYDKIINLRPTCNQLATDCISREAAIELVMQYCPDDDGSCSKADRDIRELLDDLENLPSAEPERKKGKWMKGKCSECGHHAPYWCFATTYEESLFCPGCGADMRGEAE